MTITNGHDYRHVLGLKANRNIFDTAVTTAMWRLNTTITTVIDSDSMTIITVIELHDEYFYDDYFYRHTSGGHAKGILWFPRCLISAPPLNLSLSLWTKGEGIYPCELKQKVSRAL